jgi:NAD(P)-dependent dehydrogenase (short-subunit alcohol dehydrogenase family)
LIGNPGQSNYGAAKAGIANFTQIWHMELARYEVRTNAVAPVARTRMTETTFGDIDTSEAAFDLMSPDNISPLVVFLSSDLSNDISGEVFQVKAGDVDRYLPWSNPRQISKEDGPWSVEGLNAKIRDLY